MQMNAFPLLIFILSLHSTEPKMNEKYQLIIRFEGLTQKRGKIRIAIFNTPNSFLKSNPFATKSIEVTEFSVEGKILLPRGKYAISAYHDRNNDTELDLNFLGIPKEPYGFSNNPKRGFGPASYEEAVFELESNNKTLEIRLK